MKMNIRISNAPPGDARITPPELRTMAQLVATKLTELMRLHGIKSIGAKPIQIGARSVLKKEYTPFQTDPPGAYVAIREEAVALIAQYMSLFGLTAIEMQPTGEDIKVIMDTWGQIQTEAATIDLAETAKAPPVQDPDTAPVEPPTDMVSDLPK